MKIIPKKRWKRAVLLEVILILAIILAWVGSACTSYVRFRTSDRAQALLGGVGKTVRLRGAFPGTGPDDSITGELTDAGFQYEWGKWWVIYLSVGIAEPMTRVDGSYTGGRSLQTILSPFELDRITFVNHPADRQLNTTGK